MRAGFFSTALIEEKICFSLFSFLRKRKGAQKKKLQRMSLLLASNVLPLTLRVSRFTLIPAKIYDIKTKLYTRAAGVSTHYADSSAYLTVS